MRSRPDLTIALVHCPWFSEISVPLGLGYLKSTLQNLGMTVIPFDIECRLQMEHPDLQWQLGRLINRPAKIPHVEYFKRPDIAMEIVSGRIQSTPFWSDDESERQTINRFREVLGGFCREVISLEPDVILCSSYTSSLVFTLMAAKQFKMNRPAIPVGMGGPGILDQETQRFLLKTGWVDALAEGEAETIIGPVIEWMMRGERECRVFRSFDPIGMDDLPIPDFSGFPWPGISFDVYRIRSHTHLPAIPISLSRGCAMRCGFCSESVQWKNVNRQRPVSQWIEEIKHQRQRYNSNQFFICDSLLNSSPKRIDSIIEQLSQLDGACFFQYAYLRPFNLDKSHFEGMYKSGFRHISFGVESGSQELLNRMKKGTKLREIHQVITDAVTSGFNVQVPVIFGLPGETRQNMLDSIYFFYQLYHSLPFEKRTLFQLTHTSFRLIAGSPIFHSPEQYGIVLKPIGMDITIYNDNNTHDMTSFFTSWENDTDDNERSFRFYMYRSGLDPISHYSGEEPHEFMLEMGQNIGKYLDDSDRFTQGNVTVSFRSSPVHSEAEKALIRVYRLIQKDIQIIPDGHAYIFERAMKGDDVATIVQSFALQYNVSEKRYRQIIQTTLGCFLYQGYLSFVRKFSRIPSPE